LNISKNKLRLKTSIFEFGFNFIFVTFNIQNGIQLLEYALKQYKRVSKSYIPLNQYPIEGHPTSTS
jgi:hypothetical protein